MISNKTVIAIDVCVAIAEMQSGGPVTASALSERLELSVSHLENILKVLKHNQLVCATRGPGGGYTIQVGFDTMSLWDIATVFETTYGVSERAQAADATAADQADPNCVESDHQRIAASYELALEEVVVQHLSGLLLSDVVGFTQNELSYAKPLKNPFKLRSLKTFKIPKVPNSVFQLHMAMS